MALLKYKNISSSDLMFVRAKTARTTRSNTKPIVVALNDEILAIIDKWGNKPVFPNAYVFPILTDGLTPSKEAALIKQATKTINKYMKRIGEALKLDLSITTYTARHSFATVLKRSNYSMEKISDALGHTNFRTTENYLDSFEDETRKSISKALLAFTSETEKATD